MKLFRIILFVVSLHLLNSSRCLSLILLLNVCCNPKILYFYSKMQKKTHWTYFNRLVEENLKSLASCIQILKKISVKSKEKPFCPNNVIYIINFTVNKHCFSFVSNTMDIILLHKCNERAYVCIKRDSLHFSLNNVVSLRWPKRRIMYIVYSVHKCVNKEKGYENNNEPYLFCSI